MKKLTSPESYDIWCDAIQTELRMRGVFQVVMSAYPRPQILISTDENNISERVALASIEKQEKWDRDNIQAVGIIWNTLSDAIRHEFIHHTNAYDLLRAIQRKYQVVYNVQSFEGLQKVILTQHSSCKDIVEYIQKMTAALDQFAKSLKQGVILDDSVRTQFLLCNLGEVWQPFLTSYLNSRFDKDTTTFDEVASVLLQARKPSG